MYFIYFFEIVKFFNKKSSTSSSVLTGKGRAKAFTLAELITSMVIISILILIVFVFTTANIENLATNTTKVATVEWGLSLEEAFSNYRNNWYSSGQIIEVNLWVSPNQALLLKTPDNEHWVLFGIVNVNANSWTLQREYVYWNNFIGYLELTWVDAVTNVWEFFNLKFPEDKIFRKLRAKDFKVTKYNVWTGELLDIYISVVKALDKSMAWTKFSELKDDILVGEFNLVY